MGTCDPADSRQYEADGLQSHRLQTGSHKNDKNHYNRRSIYVHVISYQQIELTIIYFENQLIS